jgi:hypothetical protein
MSADDEIIDQHDDEDSEPEVEDIESIVPPMPAENARWYSRFVAYLALGAGRSVRGVYNREKGNERSKSVPASWSDAAHSFEWQRRAEVYDAHRRTQVFKIGNASDVERIRKLDKVAEAMYRQLIANIEHIPVNERFIERYIAVLDLLARHTGGYAAQRIEHTGKDGKAIEMEGGITQQVIFYMPEYDELPEIGAVPGDGAAQPVDDTVSEENSDGPGEAQ